MKAHCNINLHVHRFLLGVPFKNCYRGDVIGHVTRTVRISRGFGKTTLSLMQERLVGPDWYLKGALIFLDENINGIGDLLMSFVECLLFRYLSTKKFKTNSYMRFECMLFVMASTVSLHSDSFVARIYTIFQFVVAW